MPSLKECSRSAAVSFSPLGPHLAAGTVAGVIDMSFSTTSVLEVFNTDFASSSKEMRAEGGPSSAPERFQRLAWGTLGSDSGAHKEGVIAGGLADGNILVWDAAKIISLPAAPEGSNTHVSKLAKHAGPVRGLQFNSLNSPHLLASGGADSEINVWNLTDIRRPTSYPASKTGANGQTPSAEISTLAWNHKADHILATGAAGAVTVWDLKQQRPRSVLRDDNRNPRRCSAVAWHPSVATQIVVAYEDDHNPVMQLWDLRQTVSYVHEFQGHHKGILGLSWCLQDPRMLLSTGKDSRTILWDASGSALGELVTPSFNFDVQWSPTHAGVFATSSYGGGDGQDGTVELHSLSSFAQPSTGVSNGYTEQMPLGKVPAWLKRPVGASFGFGGKLVSFSNEKRKLADRTVNVAQITLRQVTTETELVDRSQQFEAAISGGDKASLISFCDAQAAQSSPQEAETWKFLRVHYEDDPRRTLMTHLGFEGMLPPQEVVTETADVGAAAQQLQHLDMGQPAPDPMPLPEGDGTDFFEQEGELFDSQQPASVAAPATGNHAAAKPATPKSSSPKIAADQPGEREADIQKALYVGNYGAALDACLEAGRMADALIIGHMGQGAYLARAQAEYMKRQPRPYMRLVRAVMDNDLLSLVKTKALSGWKETLAMLTAYSDGEELAGLCDALARRLAASGQTHAATLAWICAGNVDQTIRAWTLALQQTGVTVSGLQSLMERSVVLGMGARQETASPALAELLSQYASILASQGRMSMALEYLDMIPGDSAGPTAVLKDRIYHSGNAGVLQHSPAPPFPFAEQPVAAAAASTAPQLPSQTSIGSMSNDYYSQNAYKTSGAYGGTSYGSSAGPASAYQQQAPQPSYQDYYGSQPSYDYGQQGGYPVGGGSYATTAPPTAPLPQQYAAQPSPQQYPAQPKQASPPAFDPSAYSGGYDQQAFSTSYQAPAQPQIPQRASQGGQGSQWQGSSSGSGQDWNQPQVYQPAVPPPQPSVVPPPNLFVPTRSSATAAPPQQQVQPPVMFVPTLPSQQSQGAPSTLTYGATAPPQTPPAPSTPRPPPAPAGPPPNINISNADTSKVPADAQSIVKTLRTVFDRCAPAAAGAPGKRREMDDTARRLGQLFWRLNSDDISPRVKASLKELCAALDARDFTGAFQRQVALTSSDWDECSTFLTGLKRLIKAAQTLG